MKRWMLIIFLLAVPFVFAEQDGVSEIEFLSNTADCNAAYTGNFSAGDTIYVRAKLNNTGDEDLINARVFTIDDDMNGNFGRYTAGNQYVDIAVNESIIICYPLATLSTYTPGLWRGRLYFRNFNSVELHPIQWFYFNITNTGTYESVKLTLQTPNPIVVAIDEQRQIPITLENLNPTAEFTGRLWLGNGVATFLDGTTSKDITIPAGSTYDDTVLTNNFSEPYMGHLGHHVDSADGQTLIRRWFAFNVEGDFYRFKVYQLYTDSSVYADGETGTVSAYIRNMGNMNWDSDCCTYRIQVRARNSGGGWTDIYDETFPYPGVHTVNQYEWYMNAEFTNTLGQVMSEYYVYFYTYGPSGEEMKRYNGLWYSYYSPDNFPDRTSSCTFNEYTTPIGVVLNQTCPALGSSTIFVRADGVPSSLQAVEGSLNLWWGGTVDEAEGYFLKGSTDAVYQLEYMLFKTVELDGFRIGPLLVMLSFFVFAFLFWKQEE